MTTLKLDTLSDRIKAHKNALVNIVNAERTDHCAQQDEQDFSGCESGSQSALQCSHMGFQFLIASLGCFISCFVFYYKGYSYYTVKGELYDFCFSFDARRT